MSTQKERDENEKFSDKLNKEIAGNNKDAYDYLSLMFRAWRLLDDLYDEDYPLTKEDKLLLIEILFIKIPTNKFFIKHRDTLLSQHISTWNNWRAGDYLRNKRNPNYNLAAMLDGSPATLLPVVALLTQGYEKMKQINKDIFTKCVI